jgi:p-aminobenzoyl-glutamate transporter AbgT
MENVFYFLNVDRCGYFLKMEITIVMLIIILMITVICNPRFDDYNNNNNNNNNNNLFLKTHLKISMLLQGIN